MEYGLVTDVRHIFGSIRSTVNPLQHVSLRDLASALWPS